MCGICGIVNADQSKPVSRQLLACMTDRLAHRGPDDHGYFVDGNAGLGHRRLSIIDLSGGKQPICNEDGSVAIAFNGEVYNYPELTTELQQAGHTFRTRSDTEAIVHAYEEYGEACVLQLRGMFAFAIWDKRLKRLLLVRDRLGIKPVYYYQGRDFFAFASEIKSLLEIPGVPREVDPESLNLYLSLRYVPGPRTMFRNIFKLQPGHLLVLDQAGLRIRRYWDIDYEEPQGRHDPLEEFRHLLEESVCLRLIAEVPLGVFLSGGLDSSAILAVMSKIRNGERIKTFSVGYESENGEDDKNNEFDYARLAAKTFGAEHHEYRLNASEFGEFIPELAWDLDEPLADPTCIPLYYISRLARQHITVVLSGEGADEILGGYAIYKKMLALERLREAPLAGALIPRLAWLPWSDKQKNYMQLVGLPLEQRYRGVSRGFYPSSQARLTGRPEGARAVEALMSGYFQQVPNASPLNQMLYADAKVWLPDDLLLKADKMTMANALELRVPFLDHKLVEFAARLPLRQKLNGSGKVLLRRAMRGVLPPEILGRSKKGFPVPTHTWLRGKLKQFTREALLESGSACRHCFDPRAVEELVNQQEQGTADRHQELWTLLMFEFWHRVFIDQSIQPAMNLVKAA